MELCAVLFISSFNISFIKLRVVKEFVHDHMAAAAKSLQSCPTLWDPIDGSPPGSPAPGILLNPSVLEMNIGHSHLLKGGSHVFLHLREDTSG